MFAPPKRLQILLLLMVLVLLSVPITIANAQGAGQDNNVWYNELGHNTRDPLYRYPQGAVPAGTAVTLRFRAANNDLTGVTVRIYNDRTNQQNFYLLTKVASNVVLPGDPTSYEFWEVTLPASALSTVYYYRFFAIDGTTTAFYDDDSARLGGWGEATGSEQDDSFQLTHFDPTFQTPDWIKNAVVYQVFVDRFRDGDPTNNPTAGEFFYGANDTIVRSNSTNWNTRICDPRSIAGSTSTCASRYSQNFYGGDLQGLIDELDYLNDGNPATDTDLGVTALYLNPIFESPSNHKYDTFDFFQIDDNFGDLALFQTLVTEANARGIRIILDGVFNHSSSDSVYFDRYSRWEVDGDPTTIGANDGSGACESLTSPYVSWYTFFPDVADPAPCSDDRDYPYWFGIFDSLPVFNHDYSEVRDYFIDNGTASVGPYWVQWADGWRLDVAPEIDHGTLNDPTDDYWEDFRAAVRAVNPDTYIVGEEWGNSTSWTIDNQWDATMNYQFSSAYLSFFRDETFVDNDHNGGSSAGELQPINPDQFTQRILNWQERYAPEAFAAMMNLLGSHDTSRAAFMLDHNSEGNNTALYNNPNYDWSNALARLRGVAILQLTMPGAPTIYYGDEVGTVNPPAYDGSSWQDDPYNRVPYPWLDETGTPYYAHMQTSGGTRGQMFDHYQALIGIRNDVEALRTGDLHFVSNSAPDDVVSYVRVMPDGSSGALVVVNQNEFAYTFLTVELEGWLPGNTTYTDLLTGTTYVTSGTSNVIVDVPSRGGVILVPSSAITIPTCVSDLTATASTGQVALDWSGTGIFNVLRSRLSHGGFEQIGTTTSSDYVDNTIQNGVQYWYKIVAVNSDFVTCAEGNEVSATSPFYNLADEGNSWYNLQWPPTMNVSINTTTPTAYGQIWINGVTNSAGATPNLIAEVGFGPDGVPPSDAAWEWFSTTFNVDAGNNDEYQGTMLPQSLGSFDYAYRYSGDGGSSWYYGDLNGRPYTSDQAGTLTVVACEDTTPPAAVTGLTVVTTSTDSINLGWDARTPESDLYGFRIYRRDVTNSGSFELLATVTNPSATSYSDTAVTGGNEYQYYVVAIDVCFNEAAASNTVDATAEDLFVDVTFRVTVPSPNCPAPIVIAGGFPPPYTQWNPGLYDMTLVSGETNIYERTFQILDGTTMEYKYTRGAWERVEKGADGNFEIANRQVTIDYGTNGTQIVNNTVENWRDPCVVAFSPANGATAAPSTNVTATFNQDMNNLDCFTVMNESGAVAGTRSFDAPSNVATFDPTSDLAPGTYSVNVSGCVDAGGDSQQLAEAWSFIVEPPATATSTASPTHTATRTNTPITGACIVVSRTTIGLDEALPGTSVLYNVRLSQAPAAGESVTVIPVFDSSQISVSPASRILTPANWNTGRNFTVSVVNDAIDETDPHFTTIFHTSQSNILTSVWNHTAQGCQNINVSIHDNDTTATATSTRTATSTSTVTPSATATLNVPTNTPTETATNTATSTNTTTATFTATPTETPTETATATNTATNTATATSTPSATATLTPTRTATRTNTPAPLGIHVSPQTASGIVEGGSTGTNVRLQSQPPVGETITVTSVVSDGQTTVTATRQYNSTNWNSPKTFTVMVVDDALVEGAHSGTVRFSVSSSNPGSAWNLGIVPNTFVVGIVDND